MSKESTTLYCPMCGAAVQPSDVACWSCGFRPPQGPPTPEAPAISTPTAPAFEGGHDPGVESASTPQPQIPIAPASAEVPLAWPPAGPPEQLAWTAPVAASTPASEMTPGVPWSVQHPVARRRFFPVLSAVLAILLVGTAAFAAATTNDLNQTRTDLNQRRTDLHSTQTQLASESSARQAAESQAANLNAQVQLQSSCMDALRADLTEESGIASRWTANFDATAKGSDWANSRLAYESAMNDAIADYYNAYHDAYYGYYTSANTWIAAGNTQISAAKTAAAKMTADVDAIDAETSSLETAQSALSADMASTQAKCGPGSS
jgi:hypothetical protein